MVIMKYQTTICLNLSQYLKNPFKSVYVRKNNLNICTVASTKDLHKIPKNQISVAATLVIQSSCKYTILLEY